MITNEIHEKVSIHDSQLNEIHKTIENSNASTEKLKKCSECDLTFKNKSLLRKHTKTEHWTPTVKVCEYCDEIFVENWELEIHLKIHSEAETYQRDECDKSFVLKWRLEKHKKGHRGKIFCHFYNNMKHCPYEKIGCMFLHEDSETCKFGVKCTNEMCQFKHLDNDETDDDETNTDQDETNTYDDERQNDEDEEVEEIIFKCGKCDQKFKSKNDLSKHGKPRVARSRNI